ncbi:MAG: HEPN domain-containing protein [Candidatus Asgardarchaeia archaeon]
MSFEEAEILGERANSFLSNAEYLIRVKKWDIAIFSIEQYCQLILKYKLLVKSGSYPRTHSMRELVKRLSLYDRRVRILLEDENSLLYLTKIEDAYIASRYLPRRYDEREVLDTLRFVKEVFKPIVDRV